MRPIHIKDANADYAKPADWDEKTMGSCGSLPIRREVIGTPGSGAYLSMKSNWLPSAEELAILNAGGAVELECCGVQPAVSVAAVPCADPEILRSRIAAVPSAEYHDRNNPSNVG